MMQLSEAIQDRACRGSGVRIGSFTIRCCAVGEWFVYREGQMMFDTHLIGFDSFELALDAVLGVPVRPD